MKKIKSECMGMHPRRRKLTEMQKAVKCKTLGIADYMTRLKEEKNKGG